MVATPNGEREIEDKIVRRAKMEVTPELLLEWLKFDGGVIRGIRLAENDNIELIIEHKDMPDWRQGDSLPEVRPLYHRLYTKYRGILQQGNNSYQSNKERLI
jgi:hypothetical protein